jgi:hypothetical protein
MLAYRAYSLQAGEKLSKHPPAGPFYNNPPTLFINIQGNSELIRASLVVMILTS